MATLRTQVYGKEYALACDDGQERHLQQLVEQVNDRIARLNTHLGHVPDSMMLLYGALMLADELHEARSEIARMRQHLQAAEQLNSSAAPNTELEATMASTLQDIATRIETIAAKLA